MKDLDETRTSAEQDWQTAPDARSFVAGSTTNVDPSSAILLDLLRTSGELHLDSDSSSPLTAGLSLLAGALKADLHLVSISDTARSVATAGAAIEGFPFFDDSSVRAAGSAGGWLERDSTLFVVTKAFESMPRIMLAARASSGSVPRLDVGMLWVGAEWCAAQSRAMERVALVLRRAERAKYMAMRRMARRMGHDFRNVLAAIMSHTEFALTALGENHVAYRNLEDVVLAAREAASRVDNLRGIAGQVERNHAPVDASALVNSMSSLLQAFIPKGITFSINTDDGCRTYVHPQHLRLMLVSLVTNAAEALGDEQGSIEVAVGIDPADPRFVSIRVADDGPGMTPEVRSSAIDPYFTTRQDADGLGLATVYGLVQGYGGQFEISTRLGEGTCVTAKFPRASLPARSTG